MEGGDHPEIKTFTSKEEEEAERCGGVKKGMKKENKETREVERGGYGD